MPLVYFEEYLDTLSALPHDLQVNLTKLRELECTSQEIDLSQACRKVQQNPANMEDRAYLKYSLLEAITRAGDKRAVAGMLLQTVLKYSEKLEDDLEAFQEEVRLKKQAFSPDTSLPISTAPQHSNKKKSKKQAKEECFCGGKGKGEMVGCENPECPLEWFHLVCVGLSRIPAGKWYCRDCARK